MNNLQPCQVTELVFRIEVWDSTRKGIVRAAVDRFKQAEISDIEKHKIKRALADLSLELPTPELIYRHNDKYRFAFLTGSPAINRYLDDLIRLFTLINNDVRLILIPDGTTLFRCRGWGQQVLIKATDLEHDAEISLKKTSIKHVLEHHKYLRVNKN